MRGDVTTRGTSTPGVGVVGETADDIAVSDVMTTEIVAVTTRESVAAAYEALLDAGFHHLPVVDEVGRPLALLDAATLAEAWPVSARDDRRTTIADVLPRRRPDCVLAGATLRVAAVDMYLGRTDAVCVVDDAGVLVGLLTARDVVGVVAGRLPRRVPA